MPAARRTSALILFWRIHRWVLQKTNGRIGSRILGHHVLLLTTTGHKSGEPRTIALYTFPDRGAYVVVASNAGHISHPAWYRNLKQNPEAEIRIGGRRHPVKARDAAGVERERLWGLITARDDSYAEYQAQVAREIPVVILDPQDERPTKSR